MSTPRLYFFCGRYLTANNLVCSLSGMEAPIQEAIRIAGSQTALAKIVGVSQAAVSKWSLGGAVSAKNAISIERATSGQISAADLRPDIFGSRMPPPKDESL